MNLKNKKSDLTNIIAFTIIVFSLIMMLIFYIYQEIQLKNNIQKTGYSILNSLITDTRHSLQKGERNTFQGVLDQVKTLQNIDSVALYNTNTLMTYKSNEMTVGLPFLKLNGKLINPNEKLYAKTNGSHIRDDWSFRRNDMSKHKELVKSYEDFKNIKSKNCSTCHYVLDDNLQFDKNRKTHIINKDKSNFYYNIPIERDCIRCHTHWIKGHSAGYLSITMDNEKVTSQASSRLKYFFMILSIVIVSFLIIGYFIKALNKKLQSTQNKLEDQVNHDSMTGLFNRRYLYQVAKGLIEESILNAKEMHVIMFDIDNFKNINDTHGHDIGDKVIIALSKTVLDSLRNSDIVARWGGEEFLILLPNTNKNATMMIGEKIRSSIESLHVKKIKFTISIGISCLNQDNDIDDIIKRADLALYEAKETGKNKICYM